MGKRIPFEKPDVLNYARIAYVAIQVIILGTYYYISMKVRVGGNVLGTGIDGTRADQG